MAINVPIQHIDLASAHIDDRLKAIIKIAGETGKDTPRTIAIAGQDYVIDDDEVSAVWKEDALTTSALYLRSDGIVYRNWSNTNGHDSFEISLSFQEMAQRPVDALEAFNERLTD